MRWDYGWGWGMSFGWLFMVVFWVFVVLCIAYFIRMIAGSSKRGEKEESAMDILKKRYARGEISKEEFDRIRDDLTRT